MSGNEPLSDSCRHRWSSGVCLNCLATQPSTLAADLLAHLDAAGLTSRSIDQLTQWCAWAHDTRWLELRITIDGPTSAPIYAVEAHTLDLCPARDCRVDHVYRGAGRNLTEACNNTLERIQAT